MKTVGSKSALAIELSHVKGFNSPKVRLEQYQTESEVAADMLWIAYMSGNIEDKHIIDAGAGTGILGIGALMLGASHVTFIEKDPEAIVILENNLKLKISEELIEDNSYSIEEKDIKNADTKADTTIQNPPFGVKNRKADKIFLEKAISNTDITYSLHKSESQSFINALCKDMKCKVIGRVDYNYPLKQTYAYHTKRIQRINVTCFIISKHF